ncbi:hypothetical protein Tco_0290418 [Tanacetum coccineum]
MEGNSNLNQPVLDRKPSKRKLPQKVRKGKPTFQLVDEDDEAQQESIPQEEGDDPDLELAKKMSLEAHQEKGEGEGDDADMERAIKLTVRGPSSIVISKGTSPKGQDCSLEKPTRGVFKSTQRDRIDGFSFKIQCLYITSHELPLSSALILDIDLCRAHDLRGNGIIMEYLVNISKRRAFWSLNEDILKINDSDYQYVVSIKEDTAYLCLHLPKTTKETSSIRRI